MIFEINKLKWTREPDNYTVAPDRIEIVTSPHTDLWQRTYYHFRNDNAPVLQMTTEEKVAQLLELAPEIWSLDAPTGEDEETSLGKLVENAEALDPQAELVRSEMKELSEQLLGMLTDRQRQVLRLHFGLEDGTCHSLEEIGTMFGISKERVRQIERQAMERLQRLGAGVGLEDFLE